MARATCRILVVTAVFGVASSFERVAHSGDVQEQQLAQALFDEARRLMDTKSYAEACPKLVESQRLDPGGGTLLNIAVCHEKEGKLATAKLDFDEALAAATKDRRKDRQVIARERLAAIEPLVPRVRVVVATASDAEGLELKLDGHVLHRTAWGVATALDPGPHVIDASAPGRTPWTTSIVLEPSQKKTIDVPPLAPLSQLPQTPLPPNAVDVRRPVVVQRPMVVTDFGASSPVDLSSDAPGAGPPRRANPVYYTALGVTVVAAATSAITGVLAVTAAKDAKEGCLPDRKYCRDQESTDAADRSRTFAWVSSVTLGVAAAGFVMVLIVPSRKAASPAALRASALPGGAALDLSGTF